MTDSPASTGAAYLAAASVFIASLDINLMISIGSFLLAIIAFCFNWKLRKDELELKRERFEFDKRKANKKTTENR